jgi:hypothetical protein
MHQRPSSALDGAYQQTVVRDSLGEREYLFVVGEKP